ncbi:MAG: S8 family serine peptidase [Lachnospiraceae bacterium]|nr:S8 family serine peptidase [Lachnospiraceae bacterium]
MKRKSIEGIKKVLCLFLCAGLSFGGLGYPVIAGEMHGEKEGKLNQVFQEKKEKKSKEPVRAATEMLEAECVEVSNMEEMAAAVGEQNDEEMRDFSDRSLIVSGDVNRELFASCGRSILKGYGLTVLFYNSEEEAGEEYRRLKEKGVEVEINAKVKACGELEASFLQEEAEKSVLQNKRSSQKGADVTVAVLDSGYDSASLGDSRIIGGMDVTGENTVTDKNGHGTAMAAVVLMNTPDEIKVMPVRVADEAGFTTVLHMYMGIHYAMEQGADIINISMSAYKSAHSGILEAAVKEAADRGITVVVSAGNQGEDLAGYTPANIKDVVTVSAVGSDKVRDAYSNYGEGVDYCAYGSLEVTGLSGQKVTAKGTSVSAVIVSSLIALVKSQNPGISRENLFGILDSLGEDLGEIGTDPYYGRGFLTFDFLRPGEEEGGEPEKLPELLTCSWKNLTDEELNNRILEAGDVYKKRFLDDMPKEEREELLARKDILYNHRHGAVLQEISENGELGEEKRFEGTLYQYLYSEFFKEFQVNGSADKEHNGASQTIHISARSKGSYFVKLTTSQNKTPARLYVWVNGYTANPTSKYTLHAEGTDAGAFDFSKISVSAKGSGDLNEITVGGIQVKKTKHTTLKEKYQTRSYVKGDPDYKEDESGDGGLGGFGKPANACHAESQKVSFLFTHNDGEHSSSNGNYALTYQLNYSGVHGTTPGGWGEWTTLEENTCLKNGKKVHFRELICSHCKRAVKTESEEKMIPAHGHFFAPGGWSYDTCPVSGISQGVRFEQCTYNCEEEGWRKKYEYLNEIYYHVMDSQGNYPNSYTLHASAYYPANAVVPGYTYQDGEGKTYHRTTVLPDSMAPASARRQYVDIPRKEYTVRYDGNGADRGNMQEQKVYFGQTFNLLPNGFSKEGYDFKEYSTKVQGKGDTFASEQKVDRNLTWEDFGVVTLYACWNPHTYRISMDSEGAKEQGTKEVYERYGQWYSKEMEKEVSFENGKIVIPEKTRQDGALGEKERKQKFLGYFTQKNGEGQVMVKGDGTLISNIGKTGDYKYFTKDTTVYAFYQDMYAISFADNLSEMDKDIVGEEHILPKTKWKEKGKDITVFFEGAEVSSREFQPIYRLLGWSLTPEIKGEEELVLSPRKNSCTFSRDEDVILYAQWDSSFNLAYMGNGQTGGKDFIQQVKGAAEMYTFSGNERETEDLPGTGESTYFEKEVVRDTIDIATGETKDKEGNACTEKIPCSFQGFSMFADWGEQQKNKIYKKEDGERESREILLDAVKVREKTEGKGLTLGAPAPEFQFFEFMGDEKQPFVNLYVIWDEFPQIKAGDLYFSLEEAKKGCLTQDYLLGFAEASDKELVGVTDEKGTISPGEDRKHNTSFWISDYREEDFTGAEENMSLTITYCARDTVGNETRKMVTVHLVDISPRDYKKGKVRFISQEHIDTLPENSLWRTQEYAAVLKRTLNNHKTGEVYTKPSAVEQMLGAKPVKKPGSGSWERVFQVWKFTHEQVLLVQDFMERKGIHNSQQAFLDEFGYCRVQ